MSTGSISISISTKIKQPSPRVRWAMPFVGIASLFFFYGCGLQKGSGAVPNAADIHGSVSSAGKPIKGSRVQMYEVDTRGITSGPNSRIADDAVSDSAGAFSLSGAYTCSAPENLLYLVAKGGQALISSEVNNPSIMLMSALGACKDIGKLHSVSINEITTVGSIWPLATYAKSTTSIVPGGDISGFDEAMQDIAELINVAEGTAPGLTVENDEMFPVDKLNTLANIISSCVQSDGGVAGDGTPCGRLFESTPLPRATDTLAAAISIARSPERNVPDIFSVAPMKGPFQPALVSAPTNWFLPIIPLPATPTISPSSGTYTSAQTVSITDRTPGVSIYYTLDGSQASASSIPYFGPFTVSSSRTVSAVAFSNRLRSGIAASSFQIAAPVAVTVNPSVNVTLSASATQQFSASVANAADTSVIWSLNPAVGSISMTGLYTAPTTIAGAQTVVINATSVADKTKKAEASVTLMPPILIGLAPHSTTLGAAANQQFTASVVNSPNTSVVWKLNPVVGSISTTGVYTAPRVITGPQTVVVSATSVADQSKTAAATVILSSLVGTSEQAQPALRFVDAMGVNTHFGYTDTGYGNANFVASEVEKLGVKHVRDGTALVASAYPGAYTAMRQMGASGVRFAAGYGIGGQSNPYVNAYPVEIFKSGLNAMTENGVSYLEAFEGPNELDISGDPNWVADWQNNQHNLLTGDTMNVPIFSTSLAFAYNYSKIPAQRPSSNTTVYGNVHAYTGNAMPGVVWPTELTQVRLSFPEPFPLVVTESGYYDAVASGMGYVDDATEAKYIPRTFLENFRAGIYRTYIYELMDEISTWNAPLQETAGPHTCVQCSYGMITADGVEKPSFTAVKNLISILNSGATSSAPGALTYSISGGNANLHHLLLQKAPGIFDLILWQEISSFDTQTSVDISNPALPITLAVNASSVVTYDPTHGTSGTSQPISGYNVNLQVPDEALIVEITAP